MTDKQQTRKLWEMCFDDSEAFTDLYFRMRYDDSINRTIKEDGKVVAALQVIPYPMTFCGSVVATGYISGACTHPAYRNRGMMRRLMAGTLLRMWEEGSVFATLIPAEGWLYAYYSGSGFAGLFRLVSSVFAGDAGCGGAMPEKDFTIDVTAEYREEEWMYLDKKLQERPCCVLHTRQDYEVILAAIALEGGGVYTLRDREKSIVALSVIYPNNSGNHQTGELVYDTEEHGALLLQKACAYLGVSSVGVLSYEPRHAASLPFGMVRLVHAEDAFRLYAAAHPDENISFRLVDEQIPANNGCYFLRDGRCHKEAGGASDGYPVWSITRATEWLFAPSAPYMSLMLD